MSTPCKKDGFCYSDTMGFFDGIKKVAETVGEQLTTSSPTPTGIHFTSNFHAVAKVRGLSEKDALDVFHHGDLIRHNMMVRKYNGYEIGIWFFKDKITGQAIITSVWKRGRR